MARNAEQMRQNMLKNRSDNTGKKYKKHKKRGPNITKKNLRKAIKGSGGIKAEVARKLKVGVCALLLRLQDPDWHDMVLLLEEEENNIVDLAEHTVIKCMKQEDHLPTSLNAAKWYLEKSPKGAARGYRDTKTVTLQGGDSPIDVRVAGHIVVSDLPLDIRLAILNSLENNVKDTAIRVLGDREQDLEPHEGPAGEKRTGGTQTPLRAKITLRKRKGE